MTKNLTKSDLREIGFFGQSGFLQNKSLGNYNLEALGPGYVFYLLQRLLTGNITLSCGFLIITGNCQKLIVPSFPLPHVAFAFSLSSPPFPLLLVGPIN